MWFAGSHKHVEQTHVQAIELTVRGKSPPNLNRGKVIHLRSIPLDTYKTITRTMAARLPEVVWAMTFVSSVIQQIL
jgi:hypothetical protein